jgi:glycosyltransferase involved in cell wall biosynthesis
MPDPERIVVGGLVKILPLASRYPNGGQAVNVLYLVSSALPDGVVALARAAKRKGIAVVVNQNGVAYPGWYGAGYDTVNAPMVSLLRLADHVFYQSAFCQIAADRFLNVRPATSNVLYNPVDTRVFTPAAHAMTPFTMLLAGSQAKAYRVRAALETLRRVQLRVPEVRLIVTGRLGWAATHDEALRMAMTWAHELHVAERVMFVGPYTQTDAPAVFRQASLLLHTKYNDPCPTTVLEAMASGLPVVYSATGGVPELVGPDAGVGVPGELRWDRDVPPDADALAEAVCRVADRHGDYARAARQRAVDRFDVSDWLSRHEEVFQRLVA